MATANVELATKVLIPRRGNNVICRRRLLESLHEYIQLRAQVISAPAGYGKTTLLIDFANDLDIPVCWYSLDSLDKDPRLFLDGILESIRQSFPGFGEQTESRLAITNDVTKEALHLIGTLTGEMCATIPDYFIFVLEDLHFVENSEATTTLLNLFIERIPDNCHIIISSRTHVKLPAISKLTMHQEVASLNTSQLAFTPEEVKELLATQYELHLSDEEANRLAKDAEGWILGIVLRGQRLQEGKLPRASLALSQDDVFRYLASEVFERQPPEIRDFLLASSTLDIVEPEICDRLLGLSNSRKLLHNIAVQNLFTQCIDSEKAWYRYHHLFREFLRATLVEEHPDRFLMLHFKAASIFEQDERWNDAISHFLEAKRYDEAVRVINNVGESFHNAGKWVTVSRWIEALPKSMRRSDPELALLRAQGLIHLGELNEAARILTQLLHFDMNDSQWLCRAKVFSWRSAAFRLAGHFAEAKKDIKVAISILEKHDGPANILGDAYRRLAYISMDQGRFSLAGRYIRRALKYFSSTSDVGQLAEAHNLLGIIQKRLGNLVKANMHFEYAREGWQKVKNAGALAMVLNNIAYIYQRWGQYELALDSLRLGLEKARETKYQRIEACILITMADILRDLDLFDDALAKYHEGLELARQVMETYYVMCAKAGLGETYRLLGDIEKAEVLVREAISQAQEHGQSYEAALFATQLGIVEYERGQHSIAMEILHDVCDRLRDLGDKDALAKAFFHLAQASFLARKYDDAIEQLQKVADLSRELGYYGFLITEGRNAALLLQYAASKGVGGDLFINIIDRIKRRHSLQGRQTATRDSTRPSVATKPDIKACAFGETQVSVHSHLVSETQWRSNKAKEMFFYLLCCRIGQTKEQIASALWPDMSPSRASSNFHINLYRVRRAIFPTAVTLEQGQYKINPTINIWFDVSEFKHLSTQAESLPLNNETKETNLRQASELYKGPFMAEFYSEWTEMRRRELEDKYVKGLSQLAKYHSSRGEYVIAISYLEKSLAIDPYQDEVYCKMMEWHLTSGDKASALRLYKHYLDTMTRELKLAPPPHISDLHKRIMMSE